MDILFATRDISLSLLSEWIAPSDLRMLDTAMCNSLYRPLLLYLMKDKAFIIQNAVQDKSLLQWMWMRLIMKSWYGKNYSSNSARKLGLCQDKKVLRNSRLNLKTFRNVFFEKGTKDMIVRRGQIMRELSVPLYAKVLKSIVRLCPNLQSIRNLISAAVTIHSIREIRKRCQSLKEITYCGNWTSVSLEGFWEGGYQNLERVCIPRHTCDKALHKALLTVVSSNTLLRSLKVVGHHARFE